MMFLLNTYIFSRFACACTTMLIAYLLFFFTADAAAAFFLFPLYLNYIIIKTVFFSMCSLCFFFEKIWDVCDGKSKKSAPSVNEAE